MKIETQRVLRLEEEIEKKVSFIQIECAVDGKALYGTRQTALFLFIEIDRSVSKEIIETRPESSGFGSVAWKQDRIEAVDLNTLLIRRIDQGCLVGRMGLPYKTGDVPLCRVCRTVLCTDAAIEDAIAVFLVVTPQQLRLHTEQQRALRKNSGIDLFLNGR